VAVESSGQRLGLGLRGYRQQRGEHRNAREGFFVRLFSVGNFIGLCVKFWFVVFSFTTPFQ
jgi:hypothetical protein